MLITTYSFSEAHISLLDEISVYSEFVEFASFRGRFLCFELVCKRLIVLPFALIAKLFRSLSMIAKCLFAIAFVFLTLGRSCTARSFLHRKMTDLSRDVEDWIVFPIVVLSCLGQLLLGAFIHPKLAI